MAESFFSTLEFELLMRSDWHTREDARRAIFRYIEVWYNRKRRHSTLGYVSLAAYEAQVLEEVRGTRPDVKLQVSDPVAQLVEQRPFKP